MVILSKDKLVAVLYSVVFRLLVWKNGVIYLFPKLAFIPPLFSYTLPYYISVYTHKSRDIFNNNYACELLVNVLSYNKYSLDYGVYGFVIMPDQLHIIFQPGKVPLYQIVRKNTANFTRFYQKIWETDILVWDFDYYESSLEDHSSLIETQEEIHCLPAKLAERSYQDYHYSSYRFYNAASEEFAILLDKL